MKMIVLCLLISGMWAAQTQNDMEKQITRVPDSLRSKYLHRDGRPNIFYKNQNPADQKKYYMEVKKPRNPERYIAQSKPQTGQKKSFILTPDQVKAIKKKSEKAEKKRQDP